MATFPGRGIYPCAKCGVGLVKAAADESLARLSEQAPWGTFDNGEWGKQNGPLCPNCLLQFLTGKRPTEQEMGKYRELMDAVLPLWETGEPRLRNREVAKLYRQCFPKGFPRE